MGLFRRRKAPSALTDGPVPPGEQRAAPEPAPITITVRTETGQPEWTEPDIVPAPQRVTSLSADGQGLYAHELLMLDYAHTFTTGTDDFQQFWWYSYGVRDPRALLRSLPTHGFVQIGGTEATVAAQAGATLKNLLRAHGLKVSGKKADLVERALTSIPHSELDAAFPQRHFQLTDTGAAAVAANPHIGYIHRSRLDTLDIYSLTDLVRAHPHMPWRDLIWGHLNKQRMIFAAAGDWGLYTNITFGMAEFVAEEQRWKDALAILTEVIYYDLSGMGNNFDRNRRLEFIDYLFPYEKSSATIPPGITERLVRWAGKAGLTDGELAELMQGRLRRLSSALRLFTDDEIVQIVFLERTKAEADEPDEASVAELSAIYAHAHRRLTMAGR